MKTKKQGKGLKTKSRRKSLVDKALFLKKVKRSSCRFLSIKTPSLLICTKLKKFVSFEKE
jgi:hypothetical protein